jgi:NAD(P)H-dependent FMN reductase
MTASPGGLGGIRALPNIRTILASMGVNVLPQDFALSKAHEAFDEDGNAKADFVKNTLENLGKNLAEILKKVKG